MNSVKKYCSLPGLHACLFQAGYLLVSLLIISLSLSPLAIATQPENTSNSSEQADTLRFAALLASSASLHASFTHTMRDSKGQLLDQSAGWMAWLRPDNFRWEIIEPLAQTLILNATLYYQYDRDLDQLIVQPVSPEVAALPQILLAGDVAAISSRYHVEAIRAVATQSGLEDGPQLFKLMPRGGEGLFTAIIIEFAAGQLAAIDIEDDLQQTSRFEFSATRPLADVESDLFVIDPAPGTEIIHQ